jgi:hypothetical protein
MNHVEGFDFGSAFKVCGEVKLKLLGFFRVWRETLVLFGTVYGELKFGEQLMVARSLL